MKGQPAPAERDAAPPAAALDWLELPAIELGGDPLRPVYANLRARAAFGPAAAGEGPDWARPLWGDDADRVRAAAVEVLSQGGTRALEHVALPLDGKARRTSTLLQVGRLRDGRPATLLALMTDLGEGAPRTAGQDARGSSDDLGSILDVMPAGITVQDGTGKLLFVNDGAARACGFSTAAEMASASVAEVLDRFRVWDEEGRPVSADALPGRLAMAGEPVERLLRFRAAGADDGDRWAAIRALPIREPDGTVARVVNVFSDVTERRLVERWQRFLGEASAALGSSIDVGALLQALADLAVRSIADACSIEIRRQDGAVRRGRAVAHADPGRFGAADLPGTTLLREGTARLVTTVAEELPALAARGVESALAVPLTARGEVIGALTLLTAGRLARYRHADLIAAEDLARRVSITVDNLRLYGESREALRAREDLLAIVSHDLRNPLGVVLASSALLLKSSLPPEKEQRARRQVEAIQRAGHRMNRLIRDLLDFASIQGGRLTINPRPQNAADLLAEVLAVLEPLMLEKSLRMENQSAGRSVPVTCDHDRMIQALSNVIGNAIKFIGEGGTIRVGAEPEAEGGARMFVTDTGPGIPADEVAHVFDRYFQASRKNREGIGLGLSIAKGIVDAHGGRIWVDSQEGQGSTFTISLPARPEEAR